MTTLKKQKRITTLKKQKRITRSEIGKFCLMTYIDRKPDLCILISKSQVYAVRDKKIYNIDSPSQIIIVGDIEIPHIGWEGL